MILVMDVGNSNISLGLFDGKKLMNHWRMNTDKDKASDEFGIFIMDLFKHVEVDPKKVEAVVIASVVPQIMYSLEHAVRKYFDLNPLIVGPGIKTGINIKYENPKELGADRIVNAVAAYEIYKGAVIVVDFGTATKFETISSKGEYLGGAICPGVKISADALFQRTAKLPRVELVKPETVIGKNTVSNLQSGIIFGQIGQVDYIVNKIKSEMDETNIKVVATGGLSRLIAKESKTIDEINGHLSLEGLRIVYEKNTENTLK